MNSIIQTIQSIRKSRNLSKQQFADKISVHRNSVTNWERGKFEPDVATLQKISNTFNISITINPEKS